MTTTSVAPERATDRAPKRFRHDVRLRCLDVRRTTRIAPSMVRVTLGGPELEGFVSLAFDDHVKMFFSAPGETQPRLPSIGPNGIEPSDDARKPIARDYTVRRHDTKSEEIDIDFALHDEGPASDWAASAKPGDRAWIAGPRSSLVIPLDFDWHLLIADESGLPALARRLEELPKGARVVALIEVDGAADEIALRCAADADIYWAHRNGVAPNKAGGLLEALEATNLPSGDYYAWIACESLVAKQARSFLIEYRGANPKWMRASGYWRRGEAGAHDSHDE
ncbi:siderophore-interacting protein [Methylocystis sp. 9N]|uniref:Siderophore-interacting protein n=1 Tax=Methylocystis borbori TaxID=3118750 RepID=A0ABU7XCC7_9HYPH